MSQYILSTTIIKNFKKKMKMTEKTKRISSKSWYKARSAIRQEKEIKH
jgi:hypothetical protein